MASIISAGTTISTALNMSGDTSGALQLATNGTTTAVTIDTSQNVGIGTNSPAVKLNVAKTTGSSYVAYITSGVNVSGSDNGLFIGGYDENSGSKLLNIQTNTITPNGASYKSRFVVQNDGYALVAKTSASSTADNNVGVQLSATGKCIFEISGDRALILNRLNDNGIIQEFFRGAGNQVGNINAATSSVAYNTSSDYRLKKDIAPMTGALAKVSQLKPVTYKWKVDGEEGQGFIAHELQEVVPDCVTGAKDAVDADGNPSYQGIDTSFLVATLTAAIQELKAINDTQAETITALTTRIEVLENKA